MRLNFFKLYVTVCSHIQSFMSPRYAGGPRPPIRMGNPVGHIKMFQITVY